jgi:hypothetical protein
LNNTLVVSKELEEEVGSDSEDTGNAGASYAGDIV